MWLTSLPQPAAVTAAEVMAHAWNTSSRIVLNSMPVWNLSRNSAQTEYCFEKFGPFTTHDSFHRVGSKCNPDQSQVEPKTTNTHVLCAQPDHPFLLLDTDQMVCALQSFEHSIMHTCSFADLGDVLPRTSNYVLDFLWLCRLLQCSPCKESASWWQPPWQSLWRRPWNHRLRR